MIDETFLPRVVRSTLFWSALITLGLMGSRPVPEAIGFVSGVAISLAGLRALEAIVRVVIGSNGRYTSRWKMAVFGIGKYLLMGAILYFIVRSGRVSLPAFAAGVGMPSAVIFLKTAALILLSGEWIAGTDNGNWLARNRDARRHRDG